MPTQRGGISNDRNVFTGDATSPARNTVPAGTARVPGVFKNSQKIREEMLKRIYWKDTQYTKYTNNYVRYAFIRNLPVEPVMGGKDLLTYTHDRSTHYGYDIETRYTPDDVTRRTYETDPVLWNRMWEGNYVDNFNFDTKLERIATLELAKESAIAEYIHNDRHVEVKYITPQLRYYYGTSAGRLKDIGNFFTHGNKTPIRIADAPEGDVRIIDDIHSEAYSPKTNKGWDYLMDSLRFAARNDKYDENTDLLGIYFRSYFPYALSKFSIGTRLDLEGITHPQKNLVSQPISSSGRYGAGRNLKLAYDEKDASSLGYANDVFKALSKEQGVELTEYDGRTAESLADESMRDKNPKLEQYASFLDVPDSRAKERGLLDRTNRLFKEHKLSTLISRFHTTIDENGLNDKQEITDTAKSRRFGNSHGRNLLKIGALSRDYMTNDYENPYCRVWTYHHQYDRFSRMIRPFVETKEGADGSEVPVPMSQSELYELNPYSTKFENGESGGQYLERNSVLNKNGYVNIAPTKDEVDIKRCMFSIENLAWKDVPRNKGYLSNSQRGPNGGRIMWFPPYDLDFQESVRVDWNQNKFIGRGESVYTYANTERSGTLSFSLLIDHPSIINNIAKENISGQAPDNDPEGDILRFFAGCGTLNVKKPEGPAEEPPKEPEKSLENVKEVPSQEGSLVKFYVYYPNNYSGNGANAPSGNAELKNVIAATDRDWYQYLLLGKNIGYGEGYHGYEVYVPGSGEQQPNWKGVTDKQIVEENGIAPGPDRITSTVDRTKSYGYRVDSDLRQKLVDKIGNEKRTPIQSNYNDSCSFGLNSSLTYKLTGATHTFMEVVCALETVRNTITESTKQWYEGFNNRDRVNFLVGLFKGEQGKYTISVKGAATNQDSKNSLRLATRRANTVQKFLESMLSGDSNAKFVDNGTGKNKTVLITEPKTDDDNTLARKQERFAVVEIRYGNADITNLSDTSTANSPDASKDQNAEDAVKKAQAEEAQNAQPRTGEAVNGEDDTLVKRYEREDEYFKKLKIENRFLYENLTEKFKYFTPAFHSISPEGFNARLTFLQQCTRQGHTIESSSLQGYALTAGNLSFGRMPVCVLRIGDFLNTKVLINSVSINYSNGGATQWDLNPEGIGVQPMYAKVSLGLVILGGQSLEGPINRLQNAVSFNYYANTGVYDDRADIAHPVVDKRTVSITDDNGKNMSVDAYSTKTEYTNLWTPNPRG